MRLYIDDLRTPVSSEWTVARTSTEALEIVKANLDKIEYISFDHDLGGDDTTKPVAAFLEEWAFNYEPLSIRTSIHSSNPEGRRWLEEALKRSTIFLKHAVPPPFTVSEEETQ